MIPSVSGGRGRQMAREMAEQPEVLDGLLRRRAELLERLRTLVPTPLAGIAITARGSSDNAAVYGRYLLEASARRPAGLVAPSLHTLYEAGVDFSGYLAIAVSQSGATPEITEVLQRLGDGGAATVAITNEEASPLGEVADAVIGLGAGEERAVPATKTFTSSLLAFAIVAESLGTVPWSEADLGRLPAAAAYALTDEAPATEAVEALRRARGLATVGRGYLYAIALEGALKVKETALVMVEGYSAADLLHGPIAAVGEKDAVIAFRASGPSAEEMRRLTLSLQDRGVQVIVVGQGEEAALTVASSLPEQLAAIPASVRAQQLAHGLSLAMGFDPDKPEGLSKVTLT